MAGNDVKESENVVAIRLRDLRRVRGLTQEDLAERAGVEQPQISAWEGGRRAPTMDNVRKLARGLGMKDDELARELGYLDPPADREDAKPGELPPALVEAMRQMIRDHPNLGPQLARHAQDEDFPAQVRELALALGYVIRGWLAEG
jgi:transcriptional regulator with XRE-family HTH domain